MLVRLVLGEEKYGAFAANFHLYRPLRGRKPQFDKQACGTVAPLPGEQKTAQLHGLLNRRARHNAAGSLSYSA